MTGFATSRDQTIRRDSPAGTIVPGNPGEIIIFSPSSASGLTRGSAAPRTALKLSYLRLRETLGSRPSMTDLLILAAPQTLASPIWSHARP